VSWLGPLLWVIIPPFVFSRPADDQLGVLTFFIQPVDNAASWFWAVGVWIIGVVGATLLRGDGVATRIAVR
jgi:hypothetical protein